jgi:F-type H+-transporting ATPase subunit gamma
MAVEALKDLRRRVRSVRNIRQITRAMEMVAAAKLRRAQATLSAGRPYASKLQELLARLAEGSDLSSHPLFVPRKGHRKILVLFTADRGLAGSYNNAMIKAAEDLMKTEDGSEWSLVTIGRRGGDYFQKRRWPILERVQGLGGQANAAQAQRVAAFLVGLYREERVDSIWLFHQAFVSSVQSKPLLTRYLSLTPEALGLGKAATATPSPTSGAGAARLDYLLEPSADEVFDAIVSRCLASRIYITMAEAAATEHSSRMVAMNNATKNCEEMGDQLTLKLNKARQGAITKELLEIVAGAEALKG